jgi:DNA polymerase III delta prime subunit
MHKNYSKKPSLDSTSPLSERLRPSSFDDLTLDEKIKSKLQKMYEQNNVMSMLFYGKAGTGKTSAADIFAYSEFYESICLDISENNSIEFTRNVIIGAATSAPLTLRKRLIILDEADALPVPCQNALKITLEQTHDNCKFIFITNNPDKIIEPIKSRLLSVCFDPIPKDFNVLVSSHIKTAIEKMKSIRPNLSEDDISKIESIVKAKYPDYRTIANEIEFEFF